MNNESVFNKNVFETSNKLQQKANDKLHQAACRAFDAKFRNELCNAVQLVILEGGKLGVGNYDCYCPEGCLLRFYGFSGAERPLASVIHKLYPRFTYDQHCEFQSAFDNGPQPHDSIYLSPERALGLLYRKRFIK